MVHCEVSGHSGMLTEKVQVPRAPLPKNLYLQLDNTAEDNKKQFLMGFSLTVDIEVHIQGGDCRVPCSWTHT